MNIMQAPTDNHARIAVNVVIFTVVENQTLEKLLGLGVVSPEGQYISDGNGLSLFVVTMQGHEGRILPGGFLESNETIEQAARRIAEEKLGLSLKIKLRALGSFDDPARDPNHRIISFPYWGMVTFEDLRQVLGGRDRVGLELVNSQGFMQHWDESFELERYDGVSRFGSRQMPNAQKRIGHIKQLTASTPQGRILGLDHDDMVFYAWRQMRHAFNSRLDPFRYLAINPLGDEFRISDLQEFQEVCRGERLQRDTFRRAMMSESSYLRKSEVRDQSRPGKPANLYSLAAPPEDGVEGD